MAHVAFSSWAAGVRNGRTETPLLSAIMNPESTRCGASASGGSVRENLGEAEFEARYRALRAQYLSDLPQRRNAVASLWDASLQDASSSAWCELHTLAHRLSGSAPCYGLDEVGEAAQELDRLLSTKPPCREPAMLRSPVAQLLVRLDAAIASTIVADPA